MIINVNGLSHREINQKIKICALKDNEIILNNVMGQRFIGAAFSKINIIINGIAGNALGAYLNGAILTLHENAQDATGDTMNDGEIIIHGSSGDATGYAMRGGSIYVEKNVGYRAGIHMKAYNDKKPTIVIGGKTGSFLGEYQAGGNIIVLGIGYENTSIPIGSFFATGMHGGKIYLRTTNPPQVNEEKLIIRKADNSDIKDIEKNIKKYCNYFNKDYNKIINDSYYVIVANTKSPYKQLYTNH